MDSADQQIGSPRSSPQAVRFHPVAGHALAKCWPPQHESATDADRKSRATRARRCGPKSWEERRPQATTRDHGRRRRSSTHSPGQHPAFFLPQPSNNRPLARGQGERFTTWGAVSVPDVGSPDEIHHLAPQLNSWAQRKCAHQNATINLKEWPRPCGCLGGQRDRGRAVGVNSCPVPTTSVRSRALNLCQKPPAARVHFAAPAATSSNQPTPAIAATSSRIQRQPRTHHQVVCLRPQYLQV